MGEPDKLEKEPFIVCLVSSHCVGRPTPHGLTTVCAAGVKEEEEEKEAHHSSKARAASSSAASHAPAAPMHCNVAKIQQFSSWT